MLTVHWFWFLLLDKTTLLLQNNYPFPWQGRTEFHCMHRWKKHLDPDIIKGFWSKEEDEKVHKTSDTAYSYYTVCGWHRPISLFTPLLTDNGAGEQVRHQTLVFDRQAAKGTAGQTVSWALAQPPRPSGQKEQLDRWRRPHHLQSPQHSGKPVGRDCQASSWKVGWIAIWITGGQMHYLAVNCKIRGWT